MVAIARLATALLPQGICTLTENVKVSLKLLGRINASRPPNSEAAHLVNSIGAQKLLERSVLAVNGPGL